MILKAALLVALLALTALASERFAIEIQGATYPLLASQARIEGTVRLKVTLSRTGAVSRAEVLSGHPVLARAAQENIMLWRFGTPCSNRDGDGSVIEFTYVFRLDGQTNARPRTIFRYEHPNKVTLTSEALHWVPDKGKAGR